MPASAIPILPASAAGINRRIRNRADLVVSRVVIQCELNYSPVSVDRALRFFVDHDDCWHGSLEHDVLDSLAEQAIMEAAYADGQTARRLRRARVGRRRDLDDRRP